MSTKYYSINGYGINLTDFHKNYRDLTFADLERFCRQDEMTADAFFSDISTYFDDMMADGEEYERLGCECDLDYVKECGDIKEFLEDYITDNDTGLTNGGIATYLKYMIEQKENVYMTVCSDDNENTYLIYETGYPWNLTEQERALTQEKLEEIITKYFSDLVGRSETLKFDGFEVEQYG
ncbi:hypothetical protein IKQ26_05870 [bacterium]|nr:hypothetical protein [bacterium]